MKYIIIALLLIGTVKGQGLTFDSIGKNQSYFSVGKNTQSGSWFFIVQDSNGRMVAHQKDGEHLVIEDSGATISVMYNCMKNQFEWDQKQWAKRDSVKWKPYYAKKKHHFHSTGHDQYGDTTWFMDYQKRHPKEFAAQNRYNDSMDAVMLGKKLGGVWMGNVTILPKDSPINAITSTKWIRDTLSMWNGAQIWEHPISIPYPWWKKALWVVLGEAIMIIVYYIMKVRKLL